MSKEIHYHAGMELFSEDRLEEAIAELKQALDQDQNYGDALHALAMSYYHLGDIDKALEAYEQALEFDPTLAPAANQ